MANGTSAAVTEAARLDEIGFPEFTCKLVTDVFDALVSANIRQTEAYVELLKAVSQSLKDYINTTKDDIDGDQILQFLAQVLPPDNPSTDTIATKVTAGTELKEADATVLNDALSVPATAEVTNNNEVAVFRNGGMSFHRQSPAGPQIDITAYLFSSQQFLEGAIHWIDDPLSESRLRQ